MTTAERNLTEAEIQRLQAQGCTATDWSLVTIHPETDIECLTHVRFLGRNRLGRFRRMHELPGGIRLRSGVHRATLCETSVGDDCLIEDIKGGIAHYDIGCGCLIRNTDTLVTEGETTFGQGTEIAVLCETGGREIVVHSRTSAQEAYMQAMYRHDPELVRRLQSMAYDEAQRVQSSRGRVGDGSRIVHCGFLRNVLFGEECCIEGAARLDNGTICSCKEAPARVGEAVTAQDFILQCSSEVTHGAMLTRCFVGQASVVGHGFSATDVYFASNCQAENGEACSVLAGPCTVTHHKSTLLIGGLFSFMNAGSGTNQSNHMYKLGPSHQGILERGCKTGSGAHLLWPARTGAFSLIMGHCTAHADTRLFPFSYIVEQDGGNSLLPGIALRNVGTLRDEQKWPQRDKRPGEPWQTDAIVFDVYTPYVMDKICRALPLLEEWERQTAGEQDSIRWQGLTVKRSAILRGLTLYRLALARFTGDQLLKQLHRHGNVTNDLFHRLTPSTAGSGAWCDLGGLLAPQSEIDRLTSDLKTGKIRDTEASRARILYIYNNYENYAWAWTWEKIRTRFPDMNADNFVADVCLPLLHEWEEAACRLNREIIDDAGKEFSAATRTGFGIDGNDDIADMDFQHVRGCPQTNSVIDQLHRAYEDILCTVHRWETELSGYKGIEL